MATYFTPARQPFGILDESKLRSLQSVKNRQNAITPSPAHSLKRRAPSPENSDSENIDPFQIDLSSKRKRAAFDDDVSLAKQPRLETRVMSTIKTYTPPATIRHVETIKTGTTPLSAPPAAGRSPTRLHNRYEKPQTKRRFVPPSLKSSSPSISIAAALRGTLAHKRSAKSKRPIATLEDPKPKSWFFDIFEESEELQDYRMSEWTMTQSSAALEISDDESKGSCFDSRERADKGKENIDPNEMSVSTGPVTRAAAAIAAAEVATTQDTKSEEPRTPLGDLNASEFYAEGLDATSVVLVQDDSHNDDSTTEEPTTSIEPTTTTTVIPPPATERFTFSAPLESQDLHQTQPNLDLSNEPIPEWAQQASSNNPIFDPQEQDQHQDSAFIYCDATADPESADPIEVWESESAKDENENENRDENQNQNQEDTSSHGYGCIVVGEGQTISLSMESGMYLREI